MLVIDFLICGAYFLAERAWHALRVALHLAPRDDIR